MAMKPASIVNQLYRNKNLKKKKKKKKKMEEFPKKKSLRLESIIEFGISTILE